MASKKIQHLQAVVDPAPRRNLLPQDNFLTIVVNTCIEEKGASIRASGFAHQRGYGGGASTTRRKDGPTRKAARHFLHILLRVTTFNAQRVKLHQFARVVFVYPTPLPLPVWLRLRSWLLSVWIAILTPVHQQSQK